MSWSISESFWNVIHLFLGWHYFFEDTIILFKSQLCSSFMIVILPSLNPLAEYLDLWHARRINISQWSSISSVTLLKFQWSFTYCLNTFHFFVALPSLLANFCTILIIHFCTILCGSLTRRQRSDTPKYFAVCELTK